MGLELRVEIQNSCRFLIEQYVVVGDQKKVEQSAELWRFVRRRGSLISIFGIPKKSNGGPTPKYLFLKSTRDGQLEQTRKFMLRSLKSCLIAEQPKSIFTPDSTIRGA